MNGITVKAMGVVSITENRLNKFLADTISGDTAISCECEDNNCLRLIIKSKAHGTINLKLHLIEAKHDDTVSTVKFQLLERRLEGNPLKAMLLAGMPDSALNYLIKLFALPQTLMVANTGDIYTVELRAWLGQSTLAEKVILGDRILDCIKVSGVTVEDGRLIVQGRFDFSG
mgnify:CR=1 FL=1